jgi:imidazoleglycerol-phosphate dehydratase
MGRWTHLSPADWPSGRLRYALREVAATGQGRTSVRVKVAGSGDCNIETGVPVLDHLLGLLATHAGFDLALSVEPGSADAEIDAAARALGEALEEPLRASGARGAGAAAMPADEALAHVVLEASGRPLLVSNVDLSDARVGGLATDLAARFLDRLTQGAGLTLHVRLIEGSETQHVLEAIFKALGGALAEACGPRRRAEV